MLLTDPNSPLEYGIFIKTVFIFINFLMSSIIIIPSSFVLINENVIKLFFSNNLQ